MLSRSLFWGLPLLLQLPVDRCKTRCRGISLQRRLGHDGLFGAACLMALVTNPAHKPFFPPHPANAASRAGRDNPVTPASG